MPVFRYEALNPGGDKATGVVDAESARDARVKLRQQDLHVTRLAAATFVQRRSGRLARFRRYSRRRLAERVFAWRSWQRGLLTRWEYHARKFPGFVRLASILMLLNRF